VGTKYDIFAMYGKEEQEEVTKQVCRSAFVYDLLRLTPLSLPAQARRFARAMKAPLIFSSTSHSINVQKIFKVR
jgi:GTP-binding protein of the ras superfamily involved in termination of M-phase